MDNNADLARQKSINEIIERAREEREKAINTIDFLLTYKVPSVFSNGKAIIENLTEISERLNINFQGNNDDIEELRSSCISTLNTLKEQLQSVELTEEKLLHSDVIGNAYSMLEEISNKLEIIPDKIWEKNKSLILLSISEKETMQSEKSNEELERNKIEKEKAELEKQEMYLKGMLEVTLLGKKKKELEKRILEIKGKIQMLDDKLDSFGSLGNNKDNTDKTDYDEKEDDVLEF
ncbi:MAG: hypothetical protein ACI4UE_06385 [Candidatus Scatovivens sp.]